MKFRNELFWYSKMDEKSEYFESIMTWKRCERIWKLRTVSTNFKSGRKISQSWITSAVKFKKCRVIDENVGKYDDRGKKEIFIIVVDYTCTEGTTMLTFFEKCKSLGSAINAKLNSKDEFVTHVFDFLAVSCAFG
jgi:hypothetical protein